MFVFMNISQYGNIGLDNDFLVSMVIMQQGLTYKVLQYLDMLKVSQDLVNHFE